MADNPELQPRRREPLPDDPDSPEPYMVALDYIAPLEKLGYQLLKGQLGDVYSKYFTQREGYPFKGDLRIEVGGSVSLVSLINPLEAVVEIEISYRTIGETALIQWIAVPAIDVIDRVREIEIMIKAAPNISEFTRAVAQKGWRGSLVALLVHSGLLEDLEHPSPNEAIGDPDDPAAILARHSALRQESVDDDFDLEAYIATTLDPREFLKANGWQQQQQLKGVDYEYWYKRFPLPRTYVLGRTVFTQIQLTMGMWMSFKMMNAAYVDIFFISKQQAGLPIKAFNITAVGISAQVVLSGLSGKVLDGTIPVRRFALGIGPLLANIRWPKNRTSTLAASSAVSAAVNVFTKDLNQRAAQPLHQSPLEGYPPGAPPVHEALDPDDPENYLSSFGTIGHIMARYGFKETVPPDKHGGIWSRDFALRHPIMAVPTTGHVSPESLLTHYKVMVWHDRWVVQLDAIKITVHLFNKEGVSEMLWRYQAQYAGEADAAFRLNEVLAYLLGAMKDEHAPHDLIRLREILTTGIAPFMRNQ